MTKTRMTYMEKMVTFHSYPIKNITYLKMILIISTGLIRDLLDGFEGSTSGNHGSFYVFFDHQIQGVLYGLGLACLNLLLLGGTFKHSMVV